MAHPRIPFRLLADLVRVGAVVSVAAALFEFPALGAGGRFMLVLLALLVPRATGGVPAPLDLAYGVILLGAAWSSMATVAAPVEWFVYGATTGVTAAVLWLVLAAAGLFPPPPDRRPPPPRARVAGQTAVIALAVGAGWEGLRWLEAVTLNSANAAAGVSPLEHVLVGIVGALAAGWALAEWVARRSGAAAPAFDRVPQLSPHSR